MNGKDPVVKYTALAVLSAAFLACLTVALHGYWLSSGYVPPPLVVVIVGSGITTAGHILGVQQGSDKTQSGVDQGAKVARNGAGSPAEPHDPSTQRAA